MLEDNSLEYHFKGEAVAKSVTTMPATKSRCTSDPIGSRKKRRVAAYACVSTDHEEQQSSYEAQMDYYIITSTAGTIGNLCLCMLTKA